ncbi:hypothetical protein KC19_2G276900 [Ceratodon purpureus]|uniref:Phytoene synthase n=1 Tax=Ceratodon purpureus TaxID=3225 RepID=A0A8T0IYV0_CERPU|nr:hypothetical protein KC19_2G276900 [Ceratodon purpureus]
MTTAVSSTKLRNAFSYCVKQVRSNDYENYLCALHLPAGPRAAAFALRAFNIETAQAGDMKETNLAMMRLAWWRDAVDGLYKKKTLEHPVVQALGAVISENRLSKHWFTRLLEARMTDLDSTSPLSIAEVERYAEDTASSLLYLTLEASGVRNTSADHAASHIGKTAGMGLLLRASPYHGARRRSYIPLETAAKYGLAQEEMYRGQNLEALANAVHEVASVANSHLDKARSLASTVPAPAIPVLLPAVPAGVLLQTLERVNFNVFDPKLVRGVCGISPLWMHLKLKWHAYKETY